MNSNKRVFARVNLDNILYNLRNMKDAVNTYTSIMAVIKSDGYGHGAVEIAKAVEEEAYLFGFAVATIEEAVELREAGIKKPVLILGYTFPDTYEYIVTNDIRPAVFKADQARALSDEAMRQKKEIHFHIAVDTGMNRIGIKPVGESLNFISGVSWLPYVDMEGIFTHFARADESEKQPTIAQIEKFNYFVELCRKEGVNFRFRHCSNSAGIIDHREANMDMVRAGITLYGLMPSAEVKQDKIAFKSALELKSHIVYIKYIAPSEAVSYGGTYVARSERRVATIPVGYGDGYPRSLSNTGYVLIRGLRAPILGRVCMDQFMVDVSNIPDVSEGDTVTLIGTDGDRYISAEELGRLSGRFNYELICDLGSRVPRIYMKRGETVSIRYPFS